MSILASPKLRVGGWPVAAVLCALAFCASPAEAANCTITTTPVNFGSYNVFNTAPLDSAGNVRYRCNGGAKNVRISISRGQSPIFLIRAMKKGTEYFGYNLYLDAARATIWGDGSSVTEVYLGGNPPNNQYINVPIYGRIPAKQDISFGTYTDSVTVEIDF